MTRIFPSLSVIGFALWIANAGAALMLHADYVIFDQVVVKLDRVERDRRYWLDKPDAPAEQVKQLEQQRQEYHDQLKPILNRAQIHFLFLVAMGLVNLLVCSVSITYFIGTSRWCKEVVETYELDPELAVASAQLKRRSFPWSLGAILIILVVVALGGASNPGVKLSFVRDWLLPFELAIWLSAIAMAAAYYFQFRQIAAHLEIIHRIMDQVRAMRGEPEATTEHRTLRY